MSIKNSPQKNHPALQELRQAFEHRATWFYLLLDEARKRSLDWEQIGRQAIFRCGHYMAEKKFPLAENVEEFSRFFPSEAGKEVFEMQVQVDPPHSMEISFHYCPLVAAWQKLGLEEEEISLLCDMAMEGDRGIVDSYPHLSMELKERLAAGDNRCLLIITSKEKD